MCLLTAWLQQLISQIIPFIRLIHWFSEISQWYHQGIKNYNKSANEHAMPI